MKIVFLLSAFGVATVIGYRYSPFESLSSDYENIDRESDGYLRRMDELDHDQLIIEEKEDIQPRSNTFNYYEDVFKRAARCKDKYSNCKSLTKWCTKSRQIKEGCKISCGICKAPPPPPSSPPLAYVNARPRISSSEKMRIRNDCLNAHNAKRRLHQNTPPMRYSQKLADRAQTYAEYLRDNDKFEHDPARKYGFETGVGENIYKSSSNQKTAANAIPPWYNEIKNYNFRSGRSKNGGVIGHFTQLVWDDSIVLGCGVARGSSKSTWVVARYMPAGNYRGRYKEHVHPLKSSGDSFYDYEEEMVL